MESCEIFLRCSLLSDELGQLAVELRSVREGGVLQKSSSVYALCVLCLHRA